MIVLSLALLLCRPAAAVEARVVEPVPEAVVPLRLVPAPLVVPEAALAQPQSLEVPAAVGTLPPSVSFPVAATAGRVAPTAPAAQDQNPQAAEVESVAQSSRFDGRKAAEAPSPVAVSRRLHAGVYEASVDRDSSVSFRLDNGVLRASARNPSAFDSPGEFRRALSAFGKGVAAVEGSWRGEELAEFNRRTAQGASAEEGALQTWTGRQAAAAGFTKVVFPPSGRQALKTEAKGAYTAMAAYFVKPEAVRVDKDGAVWRRARVKASKDDLWERYEKEGARDAVWLLRRRSGDESLAYEFMGERKPEAGAAPDARAIFSIKDGVLSASVDETGATLLSAKDEFKAAASRWQDRLSSVRGFWLVPLESVEAARRSWLGKRAAELGLTEVALAPGGRAALFSRPVYRALTPAQ